MLFAIETSSRHGSIALVSATQVQEKRAFEGERGKNGLASSAEDLLAGRLAEIEHYAISIGPGSFTGLRLGLSFLKGLAFAHPRPTIAISSLAVIAANVTEHPESASWMTNTNATHVLAAVDARRGEVFARLFACSGNTLEALDTFPEGRYWANELAKKLPTSATVIVVGDGAAHFEAYANCQLAPPDCSKPDAVVLATLAKRELRVRDGVDAATLEPVYHQVSAAEAKMCTA